MYMHTEKRGQQHIPLLVCTFLLSSFFFTGAVFLAYAEETDACVADSDADTETLEKVLAICEQKIFETETLLENQVEEKTRAQHNIVLIDREVQSLLLNMQLNRHAIVELQTEISDIRRAIAHAQEILKTRSAEDAAELVILLEQQVIFLEKKQQEQETMQRQQQIFAEQVQRYLEEKQVILAHQSSLEQDIEDRINVYSNRSASIRGHIFGLRGGAAISFEQALEYAKQASRTTGVRPAFLLGLIKNESDLGHNIGSGTYRADMHPTRDQPLFPVITKLLGYNPETTPVSANPGFGWGGAMGPAQFIPSTWVCYGGLINTETNTCLPTDGVIRRDRRMVVGSTGDDVRRLRSFLNHNGFTVSENGGTDTDDAESIYTPALGKAIVAFQERYKKRILEQYNRTRGTGEVGPATRNAINQLNFYGGSWEYRPNRDLVRRVTKSDKPSDPWNPRDAFFASALYLRNLGAERDECRAARRYYAGENWESRIALNYCRAVVSNARMFERDIDFLRRNNL